MKNEILEELWKTKDKIAQECGNDIDKLADELREKEKNEKVPVVDFTNKSHTDNDKVIADLFGKIAFDKSYDYKKARTR